MPAVSPATVWMPEAAALESPGPATATELASLVLQVTVADAGSVPVAGEIAIEPATVGAAETVTVAVCVAGPLGPWATIL